MDSLKNLAPVDYCQPLIQHLRQTLKICDYLVKEPTRKLQSSFSNTSFKMWCYILTFVLTILTSNLILAQLEFPLQSILNECGLLREDQFYNLEKNVEDTEFPWMGILKGVDDEFICHTVLISNQYLLTAAHCFQLIRSGSFIVELGICKSKDQCMLKYDVQTYILHQKHMNNAIHDMALVKLKEPVTITDYIRPICLPSADASGIHYAAQHLAMTGRQLQGRLNLKIPVLIVDLHRCRQFFEGIFDLDDSILCGNICDNGSQFILGTALMGVSLNETCPGRYYLAAILTNSPQNCMDLTPDLFQRIDHRLDWITETIDKLEEAA